MSILRIILLALVLALVSGVYFFVDRPAPEIRGILTLAGLKDKVEVIRDKWGVPHIYARNADDLYFAQGYVTAQDRLWQMDLTRRAGLGRLAEIFGERALVADKTARTLGFARHARAATQKIGAQAKTIAEAFARGVNEFIKTHADRLPLEFGILGYKPEPWTIEDMFAILATMAQALQNNMNDVIWRARARQVLNEEKFNELNQEYSIEGTYVIDAKGAGRVASENSLSSKIEDFQFYEKTLDALERFALSYAEMASLAPTDWEGIGSNNWVVDGSLTATGKPLLANDPHLNVRQPATWYEIHLSAPGIEVTGASLPGIPGIEIGHNEKIAWGVTVVGLAVQELFIEKINPANPSQYEVQGAWHDLELIEEPIRVKGEKTPVIHKTRMTRHGPIVTGLFNEETESVALRWALFDDPKTVAEGLEGLLALNRAHDWESFRTAIAQWGFDLNFVYADVEGNIGYQMSGKLPKRPKTYQGLPVPGWSGEYEWDGFVSFEELPSLFNPETHFIATANHRIASPKYPIEIPGEWASPYRERRAVHLLQSKRAFTLEDMRAFQSDSYSEAYHKLAQMLSERLRVLSVTRGEKEILDQLKVWDGITTEASVEASIVHETAHVLVNYVFRNKLGKAANFIDDRKGLYLFFVLSQKSETLDWFDDSETAQREELSDALLLGFRQAIENLTQSYGADFRQWSWGKLFPRKFRHAFGSIPVLAGLYERTAPNSGGPLMLNRAEPSGPVTSYREILDLSKWDNSLSSVTTGQSGHPFSRFYDDQLKLWRSVQPHPMLWEREKIKKNQVALLMLLPK
jgi:penicillin amidase